MNNSHSFSITARLTAGYFLLSIVVLSGMAFFLYYALAENIQNKDLRFLADKILHLRNILKKEHVPLSVLEQEVNEGSRYLFHPFLVKITDAEGAMVMETKTDRPLPSELLFPSPHAAGEDPWKYKKYRTESGKTFLMMSAWAESPNHPGGRVLLHTALEITEEQEFLSDYRILLAYAILFGALLTSVLTILISKRGLKPLKNISDEVQKITVRRLHKRLNPQQWPSELASLVVNFDNMLGRLEESVSRLSRFSSDIAHDLRTPIQTLRGESEIMLSADRSVVQYQENLRSNLEEYDRLTHLIESLLFIERAEHTDVELKLTDFDIKSKVEKILSFYEALIEEKSITVVCTGSCRVHADPVLIERALGNLVSNGIKYTGHGGRILFTITFEDDRTVRVSVNNSGPVIEPEDLEHIFDRLYRAPHGKQVDPNGLGLGLSIVKSIMDLHGGSVHAQSDAAAGTTFTLYFPQK